MTETNRTLASLADELFRELAGICSLSPDELEVRRRRFRDEVLPHVLDHQRRAGVVRLELAVTPEGRARLEELVALERECCGPASFSLTEIGERLRLEVRRGPTSG